MRTIKAIHKAVYEPIADLMTYRAMPTQKVPMNLLDPFIFLNHHGRQKYLPKNGGLPFGPHPHRGFETVTFILEGDLVHKDSKTGSSVIKAGGIQWMTAGRGLVHAEVSSDEFRLKGGPLEILQLWVNLPAKHKMTEPKYIGLQSGEIPVVEYDGGKVKAHIISGEWHGKGGPVKPLTDISLCWIDLESGGKVQFEVPVEMNVFFYVVKGAVRVNDKDVLVHHLVEFHHDGDEINILAESDAVILFGYATPFNEPFMAYGPFVMNTKEEVMQAYDDYNKGLFGSGEL
jgi:quercetin 2,3-dioxygenase